MNKTLSLSFFQFFFLHVVKFRTAAVIAIEWSHTLWARITSNAPYSLTNLVTLLTVTYQVQFAGNKHKWKTENCAFVVPNLK